MSAKLLAGAFSAALAVVTCVAGAQPASAHGPDGGVRIEVYDGYHAGRRHYRHLRPLTGPQLYYSYHYDHIPAYPVPIFKSIHPPLVVRPAVRVISSPHVAWCHARYRSYRAQDNSFQPYHGRRRQCWSPYG
jgi:hypothetical protein